jgi:hypothetical protein
MRSADADRPSYRTIQRRRARDIAFLELVMKHRAEGNTLALLQMALDRANRAPWRQAAIARCTVATVLRVVEDVCTS